MIVITAHHKTNKDKKGNPIKVELSQEQWPQYESTGEWEYIKLEIIKNRRPDPMLNLSNYTKPKGGGGCGCGK